MVKLRIGQVKLVDLTEHFSLRQRCDSLRWVSEVLGDWLAPSPVPHTATALGTERCHAPIVQHDGREESEQGRRIEQRRKGEEENENVEDEGTQD